MGVFAAFSGGKIFSGLPGFSAPAYRGTRTASACSPLTGGSFFCTGDRGTRTAAGEFAPDGRGFFAEPQRGDSPRPAAGECADAARAHKRVDTCGFHPLVNLPFSLGESGADCRHVTASKMGNGSRVTIACLSQIIRSSQIAYCYTCGLFFTGATQGELPEGQEKVPWGMTVSRNSLAWWPRTAPTN